MRALDVACRRRLKGGRCVVLLAPLNISPKFATRRATRDPGVVRTY